MKKILMLAAASVATIGTHAANTITFQGEVTAQTCSVDVNGTADSPIVLLPTASTSDLAASGETAGQTTFNLGVSGCTASTTSTNISTVFIGNNVNSTSGNLNNTGTATNVEVQVLDPSSTAINFNSTYTGSDITLAASETSASATYYAQYYATGASTAGTVVASLQYAVSYL